MYYAAIEAFTPRVHRYYLEQDAARLTFSNVLELWQHDDAFVEFFAETLRSTPFSAYRWETPCLTNATAVEPFEFVLVDSPSLVRRPQRQTFAEYFIDPKQDVVTFNSLGGDSLLIVPVPRSDDDSIYVHLAEFMREATADQVHSLWQHVGRNVQQRVSDEPCWLSTAGGGVAWLHVRIDPHPKYYTHKPYRNIP